MTCWRRAGAETDQFSVVFRIHHLAGFLAMFAKQAGLSAGAVAIALDIFLRLGGVSREGHCQETILANGPAGYFANSVGPFMNPFDRRFYF